MLHHGPGVIVAVSRQGYPRHVRGGLRNHPWNLNRFTPAEGARRTWSHVSAPLGDRHAMSDTTTPSTAPAVASHTGDYGDAFPGSRKAYAQTDGGLQVPVRRIVAFGGRAVARRLRHERAAGPRRPRRAAGAAARLDPGPPRGRRRSAHPAGGRQRHERGAEGAHAPRAARHRAGDAAALRAEGRDHARDAVHRRARRARRPTSCATRWRAAAPSSRPTSTTRSSSR